MAATLLTALALLPQLGPTHYKPPPEPHWVAYKPDRRVRIVRPYRARLTRMAGCESTGRWHIATGNGYYGGLQFSLRSWWAVGGSGYPHRHSRLEQMYRAVRLMHVQGWGAWPVCQ